MRQSFIILSLLILITSCKKIEGPGGTSAIRGQLNGQDFSFGDKEITTVSFTTGATIEHGDYWLLNSTDSSKLYYIYYTNPTWISSADPQLQGRIGVPVSFNYSDSNLEIAQRTLDSIQQLTGLPFSLTLTQDILTITSNVTGEVVDANDYSTPFTVDVSNQGNPNTLGDTFGRGAERVYIIYGQNAFAAKDVRTNEAGAFSFEGLQKGEYTIYVLSKDPANNGVMTRESIQAGITEDNSIVEVETMNIIY